MMVLASKKSRENYGCMITLAVEITQLYMYVLYQDFGLLPESSFRLTIRLRTR